MLLMMKAIVESNTQEEDEQSEIVEVVEGLEDNDGWCF